jgi:hypothetical protein
MKISSVVILLLLLSLVLCRRHFRHHPNRNHHKPWFHHRRPHHHKMFVSSGGTHIKDQRILIEKNQHRAFFLPPNPSSIFMFITSIEPSNVYLMTRENYVKFTNHQQFTSVFSQQNTHTVKHQQQGHVNQGYVLVIENKNNFPMTAFVTLDAPVPPRRPPTPPPPHPEPVHSRFSK